MSGATNTVRRNSGYTAIPNAVARDESLSIEARGLLCLLMSYADGWTFRASHIQKMCGVGRDKYQGMARQLRDAGYLSIEPQQDEKGQFSGHVWVINDTPEPPENRVPENTAVGKQSPLSNNNSERITNHQEGGDGQTSFLEEDAKVSAIDETTEAIDHYRQVAAKAGWPSVRLVNGKRLQSLKARLDEYSLAEWRMVIDHCARSEWHCGGNERGWVADFDYFLRPSSFARNIEQADFAKSKSKPSKPAPAKREPETAEQWLDHWYSEMGWVSYKGTKWDDDHDHDVAELSGIAPDADLTPREAALSVFRYADKARDGKAAPERSEGVV